MPRILFSAGAHIHPRRTDLPSTLAFPTANRLLAALPGSDRKRLLSHCELIQLKFAQVLCLAGESITHVYFPTESFISLLSPLDNGSALEIGLVGDEGMLGVTLMLGVGVSPFQSLVQGAGLAFRISVKEFFLELESSPALQRLLKRYLYVFLGQIAQTAVCCRIHVVQARLARWLLMAQDRAHADTFHITHIFLAYMLGVRRVGVTKAASSLQQQNLICYRRGILTILDRPGLEAAACTCYKREKQTYESVMNYDQEYVRK